MALRGDYITACLNEINRRIGYVENLEEQFKTVNDIGVENLKSNEDIDEVLEKICSKLETMKEELIGAKSKLASDVNDIGGWI